MFKTKRHYLAALLTLVILCNACGGFASELRGVLRASPAFLDSLQLGDHRAAVATDFIDLSDGAANLSDDLSACHDKPCKVEAVNRFQIRFFDVERRGHFGLNPKLRQIESIINGIILAAKIYYGGGPTRAAVSTEYPVGEKEIKVKIEELKQAMRP